jgi:hypothetical protein
MLSDTGIYGYNIFISDLCGAIPRTDPFAETLVLGIELLDIAVIIYRWAYNRINIFLNTFFSLISYIGFISLKKFIIFLFSFFKGLHEDKHRSTPRQEKTRRRTGECGSCGGRRSARL